MEGGSTFSQKCHFCLLQTVVVLASLTLMMPSGALSWVSQGMRALPAPHFVMCSIRMCQAHTWEG